MPSEHAKLSPSAFNIWSNCPASIRLSEGIVEPSSPFAEEGTKAHTAAEHVLRSHLDKKNYVTEDDEPFLEDIKPYTDECIKIYEQLSVVNDDTTMHVEVRVDLSEWVPDCFGTSDCVIISGDELIVRDLKFGRGVPVSAVNNGQLRLYALGAWAKFSVLYDFKTVTYDIDQPRLNSKSSETITVEELLDWAERVVKPSAEKANESVGTAQPGAHCRWCKARGTCVARARYSIMNTTAHVGGEKLSNDELGEILDNADIIEAWIRDIRNTALCKLQDGEQVKGWKVVSGRSVRSLKDHTAVVNKLHELGFEDSVIYRPRELETLSKLEKLVGKKAFGSEFKDFIVKPEGKPTLARDEDPRETLDAASEFAEL